MCAVRRKRREGELPIVSEASLDAGSQSYRLYRNLVEFKSIAHAYAWGYVVGRRDLGETIKTHFGGANGKQG